VIERGERERDNVRAARARTGEGGYCWDRRSNRLGFVVRKELGGHYLGMGEWVKGG
jgi:hypothetical protein